MAAKRTFHIGPKLAFDEGDSKHYVVAHIDVYQGKNSGNIDVDEKAKYLPTTMKVVVNACIASGIANDPRGTCQKNRKGFLGNDEHLNMPGGAERGDFKRLYNRCSHMASTRWKDSKVLQFISTLRMTDIVEVSRCRGQNMMIVACPSDITSYQDHMDAADRGDQRCLHRAGFSSNAHLKKWYKKGSFGASDF
eukprot:10524783-Ditylum_brightwellii.AAC.1